MNPEHFVETLRTWLVASNQYKTDVNTARLITQLRDSDLLIRLLSGEPPLPYIPPYYFGRPAYDFCDGNPHVVAEVVLEGPTTVRIGWERWHVVERLDTNRTIVAYRSEAPYFILDFTTRQPTITKHDPRGWFRT